MKNLLLSAAAAFAMTAASILPASADTLARVSPAKMAALLTAAGATQVEVAKPQDGIELVKFNDGTGTVNLVLSQCNADGCEVMQMTIFFDKEESKTVSLATVNSFNAKVLNAQAALLSSGELALIDLFVTTGGVTEENVMANVVIFLQSPKLLADHLKSENIASNAVQPTVTPASATPATGILAGIATQGPRLKNLNVIELLAARSPGRKLR
ncbi:MAG: YbjN domain-containing protein [Micropepsaceae bacterium]